MASQEDSASRRGTHERPTGYRRYQPGPVEQPDLWLQDLREEMSTDGVPAGVEVEQLADDESLTAAPFDPDSMKIYTLNPTVDLLLSRLREDMIDLAPDFQRRAGIWTDVQQSRLIESLLLRIPVSSFYVAEQDNNEWSVVDGIQRLTAIARFMDPDLVGMSRLKLRGLDYLDEFHGFAYEELSGRLRIRLREAQMVVHVIQRGTPEAVKFNVFSRINTGGLPLTRQEIRHAMIPGPARAMLADLAESPAFGAATGYSVANERMADREMVLRFLAYRLAPPDDYRQQDFDQFLANSMHRVNGLSDQERARQARDFRAAMVCAEQIFDVHAFRKCRRDQTRKSPINKALFETIAVNLADLEDVERERLVDRADKVMDGFFTLMDDWDFERSISVATGDPKKVRLRFAAMRQLFVGVLDRD
ncbi:DUF262 domain-containing protein [Embleya sp. NPDC008237]|uniref:DUF262 domain-containing protein n=1 Tax=Embleya sp. NPDC008237 TaxID=3363978 RepID=UPI0036EFCD1B